MKEEANKVEVLGIKLDGKPIIQAESFDEEAGWVDVLIPKVNMTAIKRVELGEEVNISDAEIPAFDWEIKRLFGKVEVVRSK